MRTPAHAQKTPLLRAAGLLALVAIALLVAPAAPARFEPLRASFHGCGDIPAVNSYDIKAKRARCGLARRVVRAYDSAVGEGGGFTQDVLGFHCKVVGLYGDGGIQRCGARGHRVVRFLRGG